jgi:hypothetical protein
MARRYLCALLRYPVPSQYTHNPTSHSLRTGYLLLEYIEPSTGQMLSKTWNKQREDPTRKQNLFRSMARLILSLARIPQPRIGSFRFHNDGIVTLTNRPLPCSTMILENDGAPRIIQRSDTYTCTEAFVSDMLTFHDNNFLSQPNAVYDEDDGRLQMAVRTLLRAVSHHFIKRERRNGPYILQLTDCHASNFFVDNAWNITCLIDLEWVCSLPIEMLAVPYWLTGRAIDKVIEHIDEFDKVHQEFMDIFEEEERARGKEHGMSLARVMYDMWKSKGVWFYHSLTSVNAINSLLEDHICPKFSFELSSETEKIISQFWCEDSGHVVTEKLADKKKYDQQLQSLFDERVAIEASDK